MPTPGEETGLAAAARAPRSTPDPARGPRPAAVPLLCWLVVLVEGYDLVVLGAVIPTWLESGELGFTAAGATLVATLSLVGVALGATVLGPLSDRVGRRAVLVGAVASFSLFTGLVALAPSVAWIAALRLAAGIGLGAGLPVILAVAGDRSPTGSRSRATTRAMTGYHVGAVAASVLALLTVPGWRELFVVGAVAGAALLPALWWWLPAGPGTTPAAEPGAASPTRQPGPTRLLRQPYRRGTLAAVTVSFLGLLLVYGLNTWLPPLMREAGYDLGTALTLLLVLNAGAVLGLLVAGPVADRWGTRPTMLAWFAAAAVGLAVLSVRIDQGLLLHALVLLTGAVVFSAQVVLYAHVSSTVPDALRGSALGLAAGIGRLGAIVGPLLTGALVAAGAAYPWGFFLFSGVAVLAVLAALLTRPPTAQPGGAAEQPS